MQARDQLTRLLRIQELALTTRAAQKIVEGAPGRIDQIEAHFRERNAEYVAVQDQFDELKRDQTTRTGELSGLEDQRNKYMEDLMGVKNQREYATMLREIDTVKAEIAGHEDAILKDMEGIERLTGELVTHEAHIKEERAAVPAEKTPPEMGADVAGRGIVLTGGGAMLREIDKLLMEETGLPVVIADDPLTCVARGGGRVIELIDEHGPAVFGLE